MKKTIAFAFCSILLFAFSGAAQDAMPAPSADANRKSATRLDNLLNQLKTISVDLADRALEAVRGKSAARGDLEAAFLARQLDASVGFFQEFARDNRRAGELRDAAAIVSDLTKRAPAAGSNGDLWRDAQRVVADINRELGEHSGGGNNGGNTAPPSSGRAFWRGTVDKEVNLVIKNRGIETRTVSGTPHGNEVFSFTSSLPTRNVTVEAIKKSGRGTVKVIEQPNRNNDFTAIVQILDEGGGAREYQLEIVWQ